MVRNLGHTFIHLLLATFLGLFIFYLGKRSFWIIFWALAGGLIPDIDHLFYYFVYGRKSNYSIKVRGFLKKGEFSRFVIFCNQNHKQELDGLFFHSIWFTILLLVFIFRFSEKIYSVTFLASVVLHFCFDMIDDLIVLGKLNKNFIWPFKRR